MMIPSIRRRLDPAEAQRRRAAGESLAAIARACGVSERTVRRALGAGGGRRRTTAEALADLAERSPDDFRSMVDSVRRLRQRFGMRQAVRMLRCDPILIRAMLGPPFLTERDRRFLVIHDPDVRDLPLACLSARVGRSARTVKRWRDYGTVRLAALRAFAPTAPAGEPSGGWNRAPGGGSAGARPEVAPAAPPPAALGVGDGAAGSPIVRFEGCAAAPDLLS